MRTYAQTLNGNTVVGVENWDDPPGGFPDSWGMIDVTDIVPIPMVGWSYENGIFTAPPEPEIPEYDPRPYINSQVDEIDRASIRHIRAILISDPVIGVGSQDREDLVSLELRASDLLAQIDDLDNH